jgi:small subunit ribosomal protein S1
LKVDGFVPANQLSPTPIKNIKQAFPEGEELTLKVIEFDKENKKITLSAIEALRDKEQKLVEEYLAKHKLDKVTIGDLFKEKEQQKAKAQKAKQEKEKPQQKSEE